MSAAAEPPASPASAGPPAGSPGLRPEPQPARGPLPDADDIDPVLKHRLGRASQALAASVVLLGLVVLAGWWLDLPHVRSVLPGLPAMAVNTAMALVAGGAGALCMTASSPGLHRLTLALGGAVGLLGLARLLQPLTGIDPDLGAALLAPAQPASQDAASMPAVTATCLVLLGLSLACDHHDTAESRQQPAALLAGALALMGVADHLIGADVMYRHGPFANLALHTAIGLLALALSVVLARPDRGWMVTVSSPGPGGIIARRLLPLALGLPLVLATLQRLGMDHGWFGPRLGGMLASLMLIAAFSIGVLTTARALRRSEQRFRATFEQAAVGLAHIAPDGHWLRINRRLCDIVGYTRAEMQGITFHDLTHPDDQDADRNLYASVLAGEVAGGRLEKRYRRKDGRLVWVQVTVSLVRDEEGRPDYFLSVIEDIDARKAAEEALRGAEERVRQVIDAAAEHAIFRLDPSGAIASWNTGGERLTGWRSAEILGQRFSTLFTPEDRQRGVPARALGEATLHGRHVGDTLLQARDGHGFRASLSLSTIPAEAGGTDGYSVVIRDITALSEARRQLEAEHELAQVTLRAIGDGVIVTDAHGRVSQLNDMAVALTGWSEDEARGRPVAEVFRMATHDGPHTPSPVDQALRWGHVVDLPDQARLVSREGRERALEGSSAPIRLSDGQVQGAIVVFHDVTEARRLLHDVRWQASHDVLTGLVNRREFERRLRRLAGRTAQHGLQHALLYLDLDRFKAVNDACGHPAGDRLLAEVARLFEAAVRDRDTPARLGGDEFAVILENCDSGHARHVADKILRTVREYRFVHAGQVFTVGTSIGLVPFVAGTTDAEALMRLADQGLYAAKKGGKNRVVSVSADAPPDDHPASGETGFVERLGRAIRDDRLTLCRQPIVALAQPGGGERFEMLVRLRDDDGSLLLPGYFLGAAERADLMPALDRRVVEMTLRHLAADPRGLAGVALCTLNVSARSLSDPGFAEHVLRQLDETGVAASRLCFEFTESAALADLPATQRFIERLRARGCRFAIDNFGTGMASLAQLRQLPVDYVKIDGSFVERIVDSPADAEMVRAINDASHSLGKRTIAEFVASREAMALLKRLGVDYAQGHWIGQPEALARPD